MNHPPDLRPRRAPGTHPPRRRERTGRAAPLTERQRQVYDIIVASIRNSGYPPTLRELCEATGIRSNNGVTDHLRALTRKGYLSRAVGKARGIRLMIPEDDADMVSPAQARQILAALADAPGEPGTTAELIARLARTVVWMSTRSRGSRRHRARLRARLAV